MFIFTPLCGASNGFIKAVRPCKPFEAPSTKKSGNENLSFLSLSRIDIGMVNFVSEGRCIFMTLLCISDKSEKSRRL